MPQSMPRWAIILGWFVTALILAYLIWAHFSMKSWGRAAVHAAVAGHQAQQQDLNRIGVIVIPGFVPTDPTPGDWPPPDPPDFP
jgi:hypothetical protein